MRAALALVLALAALALPAAVGQGAPSEATISLVVYHAFPDPAAGTPRADPFSRDGFPAPPRLPRTLVDGVLEASDAPSGDPASTSAHFQEIRGLAQARAREVAPLAMELHGEVADGVLRARVLTVSGARMAGVVVEDGVEHDGDSGVRVHRFVARAPLAFAGNASDVLLDPAWDASRLALVAWLLDEEGRVLQSATWRAGQHGPTRVEAHVPLVEHWTATWCAPCGPSDHALALLAAQSGLPLDAPDPGTYAASASPRLLAGLAAGAALGVALVRRRAA